jgi:2-methylcitrate dehydratase
VGHARRRTEGIPLLIEKFKTNLARIYDKKQQDAILELSLDYDKLAATPVNEYLDLLAKS